MNITIIEGILFFILLVFIAWNKNTSPSWSYTLLMIALAYMFLRIVIASKEDRYLIVYTINIAVVLGLLWHFLKN